MGTSVDIQMPVKKGGFIVEDVIDRLLEQNVEWKLYVDASEDFGFDQEIVKLIATSVGEAEERVEKRLKIAHKRNKMRRLGVSSYVYLADPDVLLPYGPSMFREMIRAFERHPRLGATGVPYQNSDHVGAGSMMLRRSDFLRIGELRGVASSCVCSYISQSLLKLGLYTVPLRTVRGIHLKSEYSKESSRIESESLKMEKARSDQNGSDERSKYAEYRREEKELTRSEDGRIRGSLDKDELRSYKGKDAKFKLFFLEGSGATLERT
jgi:hypothetical protein